MWGVRGRVASLNVSPRMLFQHFQHFINAACFFRLHAVNGRVAVWRRAKDKHVNVCVDRPVCNLSELYISFAQQL